MCVYSPHAFAHTHKHPLLQLSLNASLNDSVLLICCFLHLHQWIGFITKQPSFERMFIKTVKTRIIRSLCVAAFPTGLSLFLYSLISTNAESVNVNSFTPLHLMESFWAKFLRKSIVKFIILLHRPSLVMRTNLKVSEHLFWNGYQFWLLQVIYQNNNRKILFNRQFCFLLQSFSLNS